MYLLLLFFAVTVFIWAAWFAPRASLIALCAFYLIVASAIGYEIFRFSVGPINLSLDRLLLVAIGALTAVQWKFGKLRPVRITRSELLLMGFMAYLFANAFSHDWQYVGFDFVPVVPHLIEGYVIPLVLYFAVRASIVDRRQVDVAYALIALFGVYLTFIAFCEIGGFWSLVYPRQIADPTLGIHFGRARGPFLQSVRMGIYLFCGLACLWVPIVWQGRWGKFGRLLGCVLTTGFLAALYFTYTRSIWMGTGLASLALFSMTLKGMPRRAVITAICAGAISFVVIKGGELTSIDREFGSLETQQSTDMRLVFTYVSWKMFLDRPLFGCGFGHFVTANIPYLNDRSTELRLDTIRGFVHHNTFLSVLVELGIIGLAMMMTLFFAWGRKAWLLWKDSDAEDWMRGQGLCFLLILIVYSVQMLFHDVSYSPMENGILFMMAGLMSAICAERGISAVPGSQARHPAFQGALGQFPQPSLN